MIPLCLIIGDSTGVGTGAALALQGIRCEVQARKNASSAEVLKGQPEGIVAGRVLIAAGSNDAASPALRRNLLALRQRISALNVTWLAPYHSQAAGVVSALARSFGDTVVQLSSYQTHDRVHPANYANVASSLGWSTFGGSPQGGVVSSYRMIQPPARQAGRQAVVLSFR